MARSRISARRTARRMSSGLIVMDVSMAALIVVPGWVQWPANARSRLSRSSASASDILPSGYGLFEYGEDIP